MATYSDRLAQAILATNSRVCVGLDPRIGSLPGSLRESAHRGPEQAATALGDFCRVIVDAVVGLAPVVKPQAAFFELLGPPGYAVLWEVMEHAKNAGLLVILDAKRSDIGSTAEAYAEGYFAPVEGLVGPDALTVNPYLGSDGVAPFVQRAAATDRGVYVLVKTSNPSSGELQDLTVQVADGADQVHRHVGRLVAEWGRELTGESGYSSVGAVVGATYPEQLAELRASLPAVPFLVPGYGAQGGSAQDVALAFDEHGQGAIVNSSRAIIFAYQQDPYASQFGEERFAEAAAAAARDMRDEINRALGV